MAILSQMCENNCLSARTLLLMNQYITLSAIPSFSSIPTATMVIEVVLSALESRLFLILHVIDWKWNHLFTLEYFWLKMEEVSNDAALKE